MLCDIILGDNYNYFLECNEQMLFLKLQIRKTEKSVFQ